MIEQAILDAANTPDDEFYAGLERDLLASQDLAHPCPTCLSPAGEVCRTNSKSLTQPHRPARNHAKRRTRQSERGAASSEAVQGPCAARPLTVTATSRLSDDVAQHLTLLRRERKP